MILSMPCLTRRHGECDGIRHVGGRGPARLADCDCLCHEVMDADVLVRWAEQLLTGQEP